MNSKQLKTLPIACVVLASSLISACSDSDDPPTKHYHYEVTVTNLTVAQPLSPVAFITHAEDYQVFGVGSAASAGLEVLAEGGDNSGLLAEANAANAFDARSSTQVLAPAMQENFSLRLSKRRAREAQLSLVTMLVNSNDAFTHVGSPVLAGLEVGESWSLNGLAYDAGTEANSEQAGSIPGPADGGEGYNPVRDDLADQVTLHPGVITADDGMVNSVLNQAHRWDNPVMRVRITRTQ